MVLSSGNFDKYEFFDSWRWFLTEKGLWYCKRSTYVFKDQRNFINNSYRKGDISPIQDGPFRGCSWMRGAKSPLPHPSLKSATHILQWWNLAVIPYLKKNQKIYEPCDRPLELCWHQYFFIGNQQIWLYQKIQIDWILPHNF